MLLRILQPKRAPRTLAFGLAALFLLSPLGGIAGAQDGRGGRAEPAQRPADDGGKGKFGKRKTKKELAEERRQRRRERHRRRVHRRAHKSAHRPSRRAEHRRHHKERHDQHVRRAHRERRDHRSR